MDQLSDRTYLLKQQYAGASNLNARIRLHARFSTNQYGWQPWVFDRLILPPQAHILEIGSGPANLWRENLERLPAGWDVALSDFSPGMLADARRNLGTNAGRFSYLNADAQALPIAGGTMDGVIANHMLYHVPDRPRTLAEIVRILRPGGRFYAATNGRYHLYELRAVELARRFGIDDAGWLLAKGAALRDNPLGDFTLEAGGDELARWFDNVRLYLYEDSLEVTEAEPLVAYILSLTALPPAQVNALRQGIERELAERGAIHITKSSGIFEALKPV